MSPSVEDLAFVPPPLASSSVLGSTRGAGLPVGSAGPLFYVCTRVSSWDITPGGSSPWTAFFAPLNFPSSSVMTTILGSGASNFPDLAFYLGFMTETMCSWDAHWLVPLHMW